MISNVSATQSKLEDALGYHFNNAHLLRVALSHKSFSKDNYERLEFIGDAILNYVIAVNLYNRYPKFAEGKLSKMRAALVNAQTLADIANKLNLGSYLYLGSNEDKSGGRNKTSILADSLEAILAAISIDTTILAAQKVIEHLYCDRLNTSKDLSTQDSKSQLQEYAQAKHYATPAYTVISSSGPDHKRHFVIECTISELNLIRRGQGKTKKAASQAAAKQLLDVIANQVGQQS